MHADDDDDGATLVKPPDDAGGEFDLPEAGDGPGTFIMTPDHHAQLRSPSSPHASDAVMAAWNQAPAPFAPQSEDPMALATARTMIGAPTPGPPRAELSPEIAALPPGAHLIAALPAREPKPPRSTAMTLLLSAVIGLGTVVVVVGGYLALRGDEVPPLPTAAAPVPLLPTATATATATPSAEAPHILSDADKAAIEALELMRTGVDSCASKKIRALPGTSPAVPSSLLWLKHGAYQPLNTDFVGPFFACTGFFLKGPLHFAVQWQVSEDPKQGKGIAWVDDNTDGVPERTWQFDASFSAPNKVSVGEIVKGDAATPIKKPR